jgi:hypothetical protein
MVADFFGRHHGSLVGMRSVAAPRRPSLWRRLITIATVATGSPG